MKKKKLTIDEVNRTVLAIKSQLKAGPSLLGGGELATVLYGSPFPPDGYVDPRLSRGFVDPTPT